MDENGCMRQLAQVLLAPQKGPYTLNVRVFVVPGAQRQEP